MAEVFFLISMMAEDVGKPILHCRHIVHNKKTILEIVLKEKECITLPRKGDSSRTKAWASNELGWFQGHEKIVCRSMTAYH